LKGLCIEDFLYFYDHLVYFVAICFILRRFGIFVVICYIIHILVNCVKKNLATLHISTFYWPLHGVNRFTFRVGSRKFSERPIGLYIGTSGRPVNLATTLLFQGSRSIYVPMYMYLSPTLDPLCKYVT
jgi:hypothetical protein